MAKLKNLQDELKSIFIASWRKALIVFGTLSAALSFVTIFFHIAFLPWHFVTITVVGISVAVIWARVESTTKGKRILDISERVGSLRSMNDIHSDKCHRFTYIKRQDLLDYKVAQKNNNPPSSGRDFVSIRFLEGYNASKNPTDGIIYLECSEYKTYSHEVKIAAYDTITEKELKVEFLKLNVKKKYIDFPFKIYFTKPLKQGETFKIAFSITIKNELDVLTADDEIMSICLLRYKKGVERLDFNLCLDFEPQAVNVLSQKRLGGNVFDFAGDNFTVEKYTPIDNWERLFDIGWSSQPYIIRWGCVEPRRKFYAINYRK